MATKQERHPTVYINRNEDTRKRKRTVPMEVLSLGFSRTGTMTMQAALEILGYPTWHWCTMSENPGDLVMWHEALSAKFSPDKKPFGRPEYDNLLGHWSATTDQPVSFLADDILAAYPEAKVILVERDVEKWYKSFSDAVINGTANPLNPLASIIDPGYLGQMAAQTDLIAKHYFHVQRKRTKYALFNNSAFFEEWRANARSTYLKHNEWIQKIVPKERLLLFQLEQGWEPLCEFLGKEVPGVPFPRVNESEAIREKVNAYIAESYKRTFIRFSKRTGPFAAVVLAGVVWWFIA